MFICVHCHSPLNTQNPDEFNCSACSARFGRDQLGYFVMMTEGAETSTTFEEYAEEQHHCGQAVVEFYLRPVLQSEPCTTVLDVGCGVGTSIMNLARSGFDAYGIDLPNLAPFWAAAGSDRNRLIEASGTNLPFADNSFDAVYSFGVIEHIGTVVGHCALAPDYQVQRRNYAKEILRVTRPGGRILIACPNKTFPIDIQHGPGDEVEKAGPLRSLIAEKTGMNVHKTWGKYHLLSYPEVRKLFIEEGGGREFTALPLKNYFQFGRFKKGFLRPFGSLAEMWVNHMPETIRSSFLNPYLMAQIRK